MYTGSSDQTVRCWVTEFGDLTRTYLGHKHTIQMVKFRDGLGKIAFIIISFRFIYSQP